METSTITAAAGAAVDAPTLTEALRRTAANHPDIVAVRWPDDSVSLTWSELLGRVDAVAGGLAKLGVGRGDVVAIMLANRPEFQIADLAVVTLGATPFSIYTTYPPEEIKYLIEDSGARVAVVEQAFLPVMLEAREELPGLEHVIVVDGELQPDDSGAAQSGEAGGRAGGLPEGTVSLADVEASNPDFDPSSIPGAEPEDVLTLIYTSGTTGPPKGVQLSHHNIMFAAKVTEEIINLEPGARVISWLPAAHIAERMAHHYLPTIFAGTVTCCPNPREILTYLPQVHPTWFFAVPRIWEKLKAGLETMLAGQPEEQRKPVEDAIAASLERVRLRQRGEAVPDELEARVADADEKYFAGIRAMLGLDQVEGVNVGAAPTPVEVLEFFHALGIELAELWGMSETCGAGTSNRPGAVRIGTVGPPSPGCEIRLADDGEVLVRSEFVMMGYRNQPDKTAETIDPDGWLHTGDIGELDEDGYLRLVDRKKEIIINAAGKNMSPANIEAAIKTASPLIGQAICIGDRRPYNTALIVLDADFAPQWAKQHGLDGASLEELAADPKMIEAVQEGINEANTHLARVEQIKKFEIVRGDWLPGGDELTPTMKLKRKPIAQKYEGEIEGMYG
jgi:long-subunit acyl-CoA synthetase (AMP-forming)